MSTTMILKSSSIAYIVLITCLVSMPECDSRITGFTTHLIHRDSPQSPSYDPSLSPYQRLGKALKRSLVRAKHFKKNHPNDTPESEVTYAGGEYLMQYSLGTSLVPSLCILDTGSDLIWTQCQLCLKCFNQSLPFFEPKSSQTYRAIPCNSPECYSTREASQCSSDGKNCLYYETYEDGSFSLGELASETFAFASSTSDRDKKVFIPNIIFGCGFYNYGQFSGVESGIVGLGGGRVSLIRQLGPLAQGKFSYCLIPSSDDSHSSKLHFGANARVSGKRAVSTPLVKKDPDTFYYLTLEGISVGNQRLEFYNQSNDSGHDDHEEGNIIIDSGTTLTFLPRGLYAKLENAIRDSVKLKQTQDPQGLLSLCFLTRDDTVQIPQVTVHFKGADVELSQENVFVRTGDDSLCLAAVPVPEESISHVYGNVAQTNFLVGYDLVQRTVSFKPTDCAQ